MNVIQFSKILVPLDGSELAERVVKPAVRLAEAVQAKIVLLTVVSPQAWSGDVDPVERVVQTRTYEAGLYLKAIRNRVLPATVEVEMAVLSGSAASTIIAYAREQKVDLIVMTTHGRSGLTRWSYGRVAEKVLRRAPCPTVLLRSRQELLPEHIRCVLVPLDGSALAEQVLAPTLAVAAGLGAEVVLLQVVEPAAPFGLGLEDTAVNEAETQAARDYLAGVQRRLQAGGVAVTARVVTGPVADAIIDFADANQIDLIILSSLGSSGFQIWVFGSVAERVMMGAHCATMVVRQEKVG